MGIVCVSHSRDLVPAPPRSMRSPLSAPASGAGWPGESLRRMDPFILAVQPSGVIASGHLAAGAKAQTLPASLSFRNSSTS